MFTRRQMLKGALGAALCAGSGLWRPLAALSAPGQGAVLAQARPAMGTLVEISLTGLSTDEAHEAPRIFDAAFSRITQLEKILGSHDESAPLAELRRAGRLDNPPPELLEVLRAALEQARLSGGAFNPTVKPLLEILRKKPTPDPAELEAVRRMLSWEAVRLGSGGIILEVEGMALTLDAIAKGCIVDYASADLLRLGVKNHLINAGGDILARGAKPDGSFWKSGIADPRRPGALLAAAPLREQAMASSNNSESLKDGYRHLVPPPQTDGARAKALPISASVIAPLAGTADALATALAVMPPERGLAHVEKFAGAACLLLGRDGALHKSQRWPQA
jgi:thiamine biosynthesis lipoprotein